PTPIATSPTASIQFISLQLDSPLASSAAARTIAFGSTGPGDIIVTAKVVTPSTTASICLKAGTQAPTCRKGSGTISFKGHASGATGAWTVTAIGDAASAPDVDLTITWPAKTPRLTLTNFRLDGAGEGTLNGFTAVLTARGNGNLTTVLRATGGTPKWDVLVQQSGDGSHDYSKAVVSSPISKGHQYRVTVQNTATAGSKPITLSGTLAWV
ncbi:MAG: hypothetical protein ACHQZR_09005, partial [Candidatus Limnocylindrales bacterium]